MAAIDVSIDYSEEAFYLGLTGNDVYVDIDADETTLLGLDNSNSVVGVALNGVLLFTGTSEYGYDAFFPAAYGNMKSPRKVEVDVCLGTSSFSNTYRYYMFSPCIYESPLKSKARPCSSSDYPLCG
jgi:hypothetical protein